MNSQRQQTHTLHTKPGHWVYEMVAVLPPDNLLLLSLFARIFLPVWDKSCFQFPDRHKYLPFAVLISKAFNGFSTLLDCILWNFHLYKGSSYLHHNSVLWLPYHSRMRLLQFLSVCVWIILIFLRLRSKNQKPALILIWLTLLWNDI